MMAIAYGTPTDLPTILTAVQGRIADTTGIARNLVFPSLLPDEDFGTSPPGNTFVVVKPATFNLIHANTAGSGHAAFDGRLAVHLWHRLHTDQALRDANWLLKDPEGVLAKWLKLLAALHLYDPRVTGDATSALLIEPMRLATGFDFPAKRPPGWGRLDSVWQTKFVHRTS